MFDLLMLALLGVALEPGLNAAVAFCTSGAALIHS
jgi:hypothetical protein